MVGEGAVNQLPPFSYRSDLMMGRFPTSISRMFEPSKSTAVIITLATTPKPSRPAEPGKQPVTDPQPDTDPVQPPPRDPQEDRPMQDPLPPGTDKPRL